MTDMPLLSGNQVGIEGIFFSAYLRISGVKCWRYRNLIFCPRSHMKGSLSDDWHIKVMNNGHFESF